MPRRKTVTKIPKEEKTAIVEVPAEAKELHFQIGDIEDGPLKVSPPPPIRRARAVGDARRPPPRVGPRASAGIPSGLRVRFRG